MSYPLINTVQAAAAGAAANTAVTVKLPNVTTTLPADQVGAANPIGQNSRWRLRHVIASFSTTPAAPAELTITDGVFTWTVDVTGPLALLNIDLQCAPGAEVDFTLAAASGATGHLNVSATSE